MLPALAAVLVLRYLVPTAAETDGAAWARVLEEAPIPFGALLFALFALCASYARSAISDGSTQEPRASVANPRAALGTIAAVGVAGALALLTRHSLCEPYRVLSASMLPTLEPADRVLANKLAYGLRLPLSEVRMGARPILRGDLIVFRPGADIDATEPLIKRVIGVPGDRISMRGGHPLINGWLVPSCEAGTYAFLGPTGALFGQISVEFLDGRAYLTLHAKLGGPLPGEYLVKPGELFVLGDNRSASNDSRSWSQGRGAGVPVTSVEGRVQRLWVGAERDGSADLGRLFAPLGTRPHVPGMDSHELEAAITRCLEQTPQQTRPPAPDVANPTALRDEGVP
jgi:signal peptidase I